MALIDNLVSYYKLDGNSNDSLWWNNGSDTAISYVSWKINNSASFNGTSSVVSIANSSNLNITNDISIFCWINAGAQTNTYSAFVEKHFSQSYYFWYWNAKKLSFYYGWTEVTSGADRIVEWAWQHVWVTYNRSTQTAKFYVNGSVVDTFTTFNPTVTWWTTTVLLWKQQLASRFYNWLLDEVWIWNRELTPSEVSSLYNWWIWISYPFSQTNTWLSFLFFN